MSATAVIQRGQNRGLPNIIRIMTATAYTRRYRKGR